MRKGQKMSDAQKKKQSEIQKRIGATEEYKKNMRAAKLGKPLSEKHKQSIREARKGKWTGHNYNDGPTDAEKKFAKLFPYFETEVHFGVGKGGRSVWSANFFCADFYDRDSNIVYEIDGSIHKDRKEMDARKDAFFKSKGIKVIRYTNDEVHQMYLEAHR